MASGLARAGSCWPADKTTRQIAGARGPGRLDYFDVTVCILGEPFISSGHWLGPRSLWLVTPDRPPNTANFLERGSEPQGETRARREFGSTKRFLVVSETCDHSQLARIGAVQARASRARDRQVIRYGDLAVNMVSREVTLGGIRLDLSVKEYQLLTTLASEPERVFTKRELLETVWGFRSQGRTRTLDSHASRLRQKLRVHSDATWIANEWGVGYRLRGPE